MLKARIIPCLDVKDGRVVKGVNFVDLVDAGDPVEQARLYDAAGADELCFLDITASHEDRAILYDVVQRTAEQVFMPLTVGGGVRTVADVRALLKAGADKVSINTAAVREPDFVAASAEAFGSQCTVVAVDARARHYVDTATERDDDERVDVPDWAGTYPELLVDPDEREGWEVYTHGGRRPTGIDAVKWCRRMEELGAGEILLTSMDRDGTKAGYDIEMVRSVADAVPIPVIASGGGGTPESLAEALDDGPQGGHAQAALAASIFHFKETTVGEVKRELLAAGIAVRQPVDAS